MSDPRSIFVAWPDRVAQNQFLQDQYTRYFGQSDSHDVARYSSGSARADPDPDSARLAPGRRYRSLTLPIKRNTRAEGGLAGTGRAETNRAEPCRSTAGSQQTFLCLDSSAGWQKKSALLQFPGNFRLATLFLFTKFCCLGNPNLKALSCNSCYLWYTINLKEGITFGVRVPASVA